MEVIPPQNSLVLMPTRSSIQVPHAIRVEDFFSMLNLDRAPLCFPNLHEKEKSMMDSILQGRSTFGPGGLEVIDTLDRLLTFLYDFNALTDPSY